MRRRETAVAISWVPLVYVEYRVEEVSWNRKAKAECSPGLGLGDSWPQAYEAVRQGSGREREQREECEIRAFIGQSRQRIWKLGEMLNRTRAGRNSAC